MARSNKFNPELQDTRYKRRIDNRPNKLYSPNEEEMGLRNFTYRRLKDMKNGRYSKDGINLEDKWIEWNDQYEPSRNLEYTDWESTIKPPLTTTVVEKIIAEVIDELSFPEVTHRGHEDVTAAMVMNEALKYTWDISRGKIELLDALKQIMILGNTGWWEYYHLEKRTVKMMVDINRAAKNPKDRFVYEEQEIVEYDDVYGETIPLKDLFVDPSAETINRGPNKANDCILRRNMSVDRFMSIFEGSHWDMLGNVKKVEAGKQAEYYDYYNPGKDADNVEVLFHWVRSPDLLVIVANDVLIHHGPNPYNHKQLPFAFGSDVKRLKGNGLYAIGEPEMLESIQEELTTQRRMRIDKTHLEIFGTTYYSSDNQMDDDDMYIAPGKFTEVDNPQDIRDVRPPETRASTYQEEAQLKEDAREVTGLMNPGPAPTATQAAILQETTQKALKLKIWLLANEFMWDITKLRVANIAQFWSTPKVQRLIDGTEVSQYRSIATKDFELQVERKGGNVRKVPKKGKFFFEVEPQFITPLYGTFDLVYQGDGALPVSKTIRQQRFIEYSNSPLVAGAIESGYYDPNKVVDKLTKAHDIDPDELKADTTEVEGGGIDVNASIEMAGMENEGILEGKDVPPTPFAPLAHTQLHLSFADSEAFKQAGPKAIQSWMSHVLPEIAAQRQRGENPDELLQGAPQLQAQTADLGGNPSGGIGSPRPGVASGVSNGIIEGQSKSISPNLLLGAEALGN